MEEGEGEEEVTKEGALREGLRGPPSEHDKSMNTLRQRMQIEEFKQRNAPVEVQNDVLGQRLGQGTKSCRTGGNSVSI